MDHSLASQVAALQRLSVGRLLSRYHEIYNELPNTKNRPWLIRRIAWRLQALQEGDLSERARRRAAELAQDADLRLFPPKGKSLPPAKPVNGGVGQLSDQRLPPPGSVLVRQYKQQRLAVTVLSLGFEFQGQVFPSLSAVARQITGSQCNGFLFFGLTKGERP
jgi:hypothetical protein